MAFRNLQPYLSSLFFQPLEHTKLELTPHKGPGRPGGGPVKIKKGEIIQRQKWHAGVRNVNFKKHQFLVDYK